MKKLGILLFLLSIFVDIESRWMLLEEYFIQPYKLLERFEIEKRVNNEDNA